MLVYLSCWASWGSSPPLPSAPDRRGRTANEVPGSRCSPAIPSRPFFLVHYDTISESAGNDANNSECADDAISGGSALLEAMRLFNAASLTNAANNLDWSEGSLNAAGLAAINKTGTTQLRVYFNLDDNNNRSADYIGYYSGDNGTSANRPKLVVTYQ